MDPLDVINKINTEVPVCYRSAVLAALVAGCGPKLGAAIQDIVGVTYASR